MKKIFTKMTKKLKEKEGQFIMDNAVVCIIILILAGIIILVLGDYMKDVFMPLITDKMSGLMA